MGAEAVWDRLKGAEKVVVGRGQKMNVFVPGPASKEAIMHEALGRSGTLRAPTLQVGNSYYIGYNETMYRELTA